APRALVARALREAAARAPDQDAALAAVASGWLRRFVEEFPEYGPGARRSPLLGGRAGVVTEHEAGRLEPAYGHFGFRREPFLLPDRHHWAGAATAGLGARAAAILARVEAGTEGVEVPQWDASAALGAWSLAVGREPVGYGPARGGGVVVSGATSMTRVQVQTLRPVRLPSLLRHLGGTTFHSSLARLPGSRHPGEPWFWTARVGFEPHPRVQLGINRASVFGGDSIDTPVTVENVAKMFVGILSRNFENQVIAADARWRLPTEGVLPATVYFEWGSEDASGAWWRVPGHTFGLLLPRLGSAWAGGAEVTRFAPHCCGNPPWYMHAAHPGGWVHRGRPLGHPLGGEGWEAMAYGQGELLDARLRVEGRAFARRRTHEGLAREQRAANLYAPARAGSLGGSLDAAWRLAPRIDARVSLYRDAGGGWREQSLRADLSYLF
ncbi:MAG: hypothetical protein AVDCRST_MAG68-5637, partial [uncultured Gemmatimonadetes bacterium]